MNILQRLDIKLMDSIHEFYCAFDDKPKIFTLLAALWMSLMAFSMYPFPKFMAIFFLPAILFFWVSHIYEWRVWYRDNKQREIKQPRFFPESVAPYRKWMFFLALIFSIFNGIFLKNMLRETEFIRAQFFWFITYQIIANFLGAVILIELIRLIARTGASWTNRKHILSVIATASILFVLSTIGMLYGKKLL